MHARARLRVAAPVAVVVAAALASSGCAYFLRSPGRPVPSLHYQWPRESRAAPSCLLVLLPGFFDDPDTFERQGITDDIHRAAPACDAVATSIHLYDWTDGSVVDRVYDDVVLEARRRGYERVWLVGVSMGALAAVLTARAHPGDVDGLILVSPYLGTPTYVTRLEAEIAHYGGLSEWARATPEPRLRLARVLHDPRPVWRWLARYGRGRRELERDLPPLWLGWGHDDRFADAHRLLAREIEAAHTFEVDGGHDWRTWRRIVEDVIAVLPFDGDDAASDGPSAPPRRAALPPTRGASAAGFGRRAAATGW